MAAFHLSLLGHPRLHGPEQPSATLKLSKVNALGWFIAAHLGEWIPRLRLVSVFWDQLPERDGRAALTTTLGRLRHAWPIWPFTLEGDSLRWEPHCGLTLDIHQFATWTGDGVHPPADVDSVTRLVSPYVPPGVAPTVPPSVSSLAAAAALWRGPFLDGATLSECPQYEEWLLDQRRLWETRMLDTLHTLIKAEEAAGAWDAMAGHARQALSITPFQDRFQSALMLAYLRSGDRSAALAQYNTFAELLWRKMSGIPDASTTALRDAIASDSQVEAMSPGAVVVAAQPIHLAAQVGPQRPGTPTWPPLMDRQVELKQLEMAILQAWKGEQQVVVMGGEPGIGKSRLVAELLGRLPDSGTVLAGYCHESHSGLAFAPIAEALTKGLPRVDLSRRPIPDLMLAELARLLPDMRHTHPDLVGEVTDSPGDDRWRLFEGVARFLAAMPSPVLLVVEDLHWGDSETIQLLGYLARSNTTTGLAIVVTARSEEIPEALRRLYGQLHREGRLTRLDLQPLTPKAVRALVETVTDQEHAPLLTEQLYRRALGHPLYTVEFLRSLRQGGQTHGLPPVPPTVEEVIRERLERLSPSARELIAAACIFPKGIPFTMLPAMAELSEGEALAALEEAIRKGILEETAMAYAPPTVAALGIAFRHEVLRQVVVQGLSAARQQVLHRRAFQLLLSQYTAGALPGARRESPPLAFARQMADHALAGGLWKEAADWSHVTATAAEEIFSFPTAARYLEQALTCLEHLPDSSEVAQWIADLRLRLVRVGSYFQPHRLDAWLGQPPSAVSKMSPKHERVVDEWLAHSESAIVQGRLHFATRLLDRTLPLVRALKSPSLLSQALLCQGMLYTLRGSSLTAISSLQEGLALYSRTGNTFMATAARNMLLSAYAMAGQFDKARALGEQQRQALPHMDNPILVSHAWFSLAHVEHEQGHWPTALQFSLEALATAKRARHRLLTFLGMAMQGMAMVHLDEAREGQAVLEKARSLAKHVGTHMALDRVCSCLAELHLADGKIKEAEAVATEGLNLARKHGSLFGVPLCQMAQGQVHAAAGRHTEARELLKTAMVGFKLVSAGPSIARCHAHLASAAATGSDRLFHRREAEALFLKLGMRWDLARLHSSSLAGGAGLRSEA